jgi:hypothetical protein
MLTNGRIIVNEKRLVATCGKRVFNLIYSCIFTKTVGRMGCNLVNYAKTAGFITLKGREHV